MTWTCEAYGQEGEAVGAVCFFAALNERVCASEAECHNAMVAERQRVYQRINEMAAAGNDTGVFLEGEFTSPDQLLMAGIAAMAGRDRSCRR